MPLPPPEFSKEDMAKSLLHMIDPVWLKPWATSLLLLSFSHVFNSTKMNFCVPPKCQAEYEALGYTGEQKLTCSYLWVIRPNGKTDTLETTTLITAKSHSG